MELPKYKKKYIHKLKLCQIPDCGKEYWGHATSKYCEIHREVRLRIRKRPIYKSREEDNLVFRHNFFYTGEIEFECHLPGCKKKYTVNVIPRLYLYPKYCPEHRNEYKRQMFIKNL